jgi:putative NADH-flavin reductase
MHWLVLGATGGIGRALVAQAVARSHRVTAFVRSPKRMDPSLTDVRVIEGDPRSATQLESAMVGCEGVLSTLGPPIPFTGRTTIMGDAAASTIHAMRATGLRRLVIVSGDLQFPDGGPPWLVRATLLRHLARDQLELEQLTRSSGLDWTIVRPTRLTNGGLTRVYRAEEERLPRGAKAISRLDVAHFLLRAMERGESIGRIVGLAR